MTILNFCDNCDRFVSRKYDECPKCETSLKNPKKWKINLPLPNGKRIVRIVDTKYSDARDLEAKLINDRKQGSWFGIKNAPLINDVVKKLNKHNQKRLKRPDTSRWDNHVAPFITDTMTMAQLTTHDIDKILNRMHTKGLAPATINHVLKLIRRLYNWAKKQGLYDGPNPAENIEPIKVHNQVTNYLEKRDVRRLKRVLKNWSNGRAALIVYFALFTGCRKSEIFDLQWNDVNIKGKEIFLRDPKGKPTALPISENAVDVLKQAKALRSESKYKSKYVFCNRLGGQRKHFGNTWIRIKEKAKLPDDFRFHDLRHTFATHLASSGKVSLFELQKLLNHQSISMTMRYAHHMDKALRQAVNNIDDILGKSDSGKIKIKRRKSTGKTKIKRRKI